MALVEVLAGKFPLADLAGELLCRVPGWRKGGSGT
jgi:hypothetical protein